MFFYKLNTDEDIKVKCVILLDTAERKKLNEIMNGISDLYQIDETKEEIINKACSKLLKKGKIVFEVGGFKSGIELKRYIKSITIGNELIYNQVIVNRLGTGRNQEHTGAFADLASRETIHIISPILKYLSDNFTYIDSLRSFKKQKPIEHSINLDELKFIDPSKLSQILHKIYLTDNFIYRNKFYDIIRIFNFLTQEFYSF